MKPRVLDNPDKVNIVTVRILLSSWLECWAVVAHAAPNTASGSAVLGATIRRRGVSVATALSRYRPWPAPSSSRTQHQ